MLTSSLKLIIVIFIYYNYINILRLYTLQPHIKEIGRSKTSLYRALYIEIPVYL